MTTADEKTMTTAHEKDQLIRGFDQLDASVPAARVREAYAAMRERCPVAHFDRYGGFSMVTRFEDARVVASDQRTFSNKDGSFVPPSGWPPIPPLDFDEPEHRRWVKIMQAPLSHAAVKDLEPMIHEVVNSQIDSFIGAGSTEIYSSFAEPVPVYVTGRLVGLSPEASQEMRVVAMKMFEAIGTPEFEARQDDFNAFALRELAERRRHPRDDYLSQLASGDLNGEKVNDLEVAGVLVALLVGGHHSTAAALAGLLHHTLTVPGLKDRLTADPGLIRPAIEESLRLTTPLQFFARTVLYDTEVAGEKLAAGHRVIANFASANLDERQFPHPDSFELDRGKNAHVAFGHGIHLCIGRHLARAELQIALSEVLRRLRNLRIDGEVVESGLIAGIMLSVVALPVAFDPAVPRTAG
jgi:cholest-4-en-3-one 26-monooxygenase